MRSLLRQQASDYCLGHLYGRIQCLWTTIPQYNIDVTKLERIYSEKRAVMIAHTLGTRLT